MAGHSHWKSIKHRKGAADARRGKIFSKLAKYITVAARHGGPNPADNLRLRYTIDKARAESMPKDSIERAIKKGAGDLQGAQLEELTYEGIAAGGVSLIIEVLTDNRNRTGSELRNLLEKRGGSLGKTNSVMWRFERKGVLGVSRADLSEEEIFEIALEAGADNIEESGDEFHVTAAPEGLEKVRNSLQAAIESRRAASPKRWGEGGEERPVFTRNEIVYQPRNPLKIQDATQARQLLELLGEIEDHDDVQNVHSDFDIPERVLEEVSG